VEVVASLSQGLTAAAQCGLFTYKSVPVIFEPPCIYSLILPKLIKQNKLLRLFYKHFETIHFHVTAGFIIHNFLRITTF